MVVFIDGCFWHGCPDHYRIPKSNLEFWSGKLAGNTARDLRQTGLFQSHGWRVCRVWEHEVHTDLGAVVERIIAAVCEDAWRSDNGPGGPGELESTMTTGPDPQ